jgi:hypothetical protein
MFVVFLLQDGAMSDSDDEELGMTHHSIQTLVGGATDEPPPNDEPSDTMPTATAVSTQASRASHTQ